ncbi:Thiamine biosynthesis lipoprotein ApbE precursor [Rubripirellula obstinata]|uniref:FAD:protein FMN transferase n=2 Tax=Rubripirellula obstinata TaxID=406547 RepID=A0A5B1CFL8_9BACT|nr:Thiamine biosynthesis lipoprotein ApbE precursor [Rubripirellula obstinata]
MLFVSPAAAGEIIAWSGGTMGTSYTVKAYVNDKSESGDQALPDLDELRLEVDAELRRVNDEMSNYLKSSQISRFNESDSTDWFPISKPFAEVVAYAQKVAKATDGAFDVTIGPLVNAWNFGPAARTDSVPTDAQIDELSSVVGYENLSVRLDPPAIKKSIAGLQIDLSAIAKGHGVDRVVDRLTELGIANMFVEIGGEVRTVGTKGDQAWKVGIQVPDAAADQFDIAYEMTDQSMATSGDYRNYIEIDGKRYSHTIDPRTGRPITHDLASVSIVSDLCMESDAWATAINVLGETKGLAVASEQDLSALLVSRGEDGFWRTGTGDFAAYSRPRESVTENAVADNAVAENQPWVVLAITFVAFAVLLFAMAVGVIFSGKKISGSCGGIASQQSEDGSTSCSLCSNPADACKELRERMQEKASST